MEKAVSFFDAVINKTKNITKGITSEIFKYIRKSASLTYGISILTIFGIAMLRNPKLYDGLFIFATNIRKEADVNMDLTALLNAYPVLNVDNYILAKDENIGVVEKEENEEESVKELEQSLDTSFFDVSAVDVNGESVVLKEADAVEKNTKTYTRIDIDGVTVLDYSSKKINYEEIMDMDVSLKKKEDKVLMYSTHTSESYTNSDRYKFKYSGTYRSRDEKYNMLSVANILNKTLMERGITTIMDTTPHDYVSYNNAYKNSMKTLNKNLEKYSNFGLVIDVHRDASGDLSFAPKVNINGKSVAKLMIVIGVGYGELENKYWKENLSLALNIAKLGESMYPGLFRHILVRDSRYNQHIEDGSILIEVGATGNILEEAYYSARCLGNIIATIYE